MSPNTIHWLALFGDIVIKTTLLLGLAWLATKIARRSSAAVRHMLWTIALVACLFVPAMEAVAPHRTLLTIASAPQAVPLTPNISLAPADMTNVQAPPVSTASTSTPINELPLDSVEPPLVDLGDPAPPVIMPTSPSLNLVIWAGGTWAGGSLAILLSAFVGWFSLRRINSRTFALPSAFKTSPGKRSVRLKVSLEGRPPSALTWGAFRPTILLPRTAEGWSEDRLQTVLLHEFEHIRRWDAAKQLIGVAACALYWFNPAVWLAAKAARSEAESATDDAVLSAGVLPSDYASTLMEVAAEIGRHPRMQSNAGVAFMKKSKIEARVRAILDSRSRRGVTRTEKGVALVFAVSLLGGLAVVRAAGMKPFAVLSEPSDPAVSLQAPAKPSSAHHMRALAKLLKERERRLAEAEVRVSKLQASIESLSKQLGRPTASAKHYSAKLTPRIAAAQAALIAAENELVRARMGLTSEQAKAGSTGSSAREMDRVAQELAKAMADRAQANAQSKQLAAERAAMENDLEATRKQLEDSRKRSASDDESALKAELAARVATLKVLEANRQAESASRKELEAEISRLRAAQEDLMRRAKGQAATRIELERKAEIDARRQADEATAAATRAATDLKVSQGLLRREDADEIRRAKERERQDKELRFLREQAERAEAQAKAKADKRERETKANRKLQIVAQYESAYLARENVTIADQPTDLRLYRNKSWTAQFPIDVKSPVAGPIRLSWPGVSGPSSTFFAWLRDTKTGALIDMNDTPGYSFIAKGGETRTFNVMLSAENPSSVIAKFDPTGSPAGAPVNIRYAFSAPVATELRIFDASDNVVRTLVDRKFEQAGSYRSVWNLKDDSGRRVRPGRYRVEILAARAKGSASGSAINITIS